MCGRYSLTSPPEVIKERFKLFWSPEISAHYNIAPSQMIPVVRDTEKGRELALLKWGLIPSWSKDPAIGAKLINARAETLADKPSFRNAFKRRHCLIPADSFYEWKAMRNGKQPYCIGMADHALFGMAGLWEHWVNPAGQAVQTCTIITTAANELVGELHERMPLIIQPGDYDAWLDANNSKAGDLLRPFPSEQMRYYPVSVRVNNVRNDDAECLVPVELSGSDQAPKPG
jgi:putative SOS response-associated peptidase YedK